MKAQFAGNQSKLKQEAVYLLFTFKEHSIIWWGICPIVIIDLTLNRLASKQQEMASGLKEEERSN